MATKAQQGAEENGSLTESDSAAELVLEELQRVQAELQRVHGQYHELQHRAQASRELLADCVPYFQQLAQYQQQVINSQQMRLLEAAGGGEGTPPPD